MTSPRPRRATDQAMVDADRACREISRRHGVSYFWASQLLARDQRRHVHALYALCRRADDIVDQVDGADAAARRGDLLGFRARFDEALATGHSDDRVLVAAARTVHEFELDPSLFDRFFTAMASDLDTSRYDTWDDLVVYMDGSAAAIGEMLLPVLAPTDPAAALEPARSLGLAFQLTNFLRDVDEDLDLGRQYLPQAELRAFGVDLAERRVTPDFVELMRFQIERCRELYAIAAEGEQWLPPRSARCVRTARGLYGAILDRIEDADFDVFAGRVSVPTGDKLRIVAAELRR